MENILTYGTQARVICDWFDINVGDIVNIIKYESSRGYLVRTSENSEELWVPTHVLSNNNRKPWSFSFKKPARRSMDAGTSIDMSNELCQPEFVSKIIDTSVVCGSRAVFKCKIKPFDKNTKVNWQKIEPDILMIRSTGRISITQDEDGLCSLVINNARKTDSGVYMCYVLNNFGSAKCVASLSVTNSLPNLCEPKVQIISSTSVLLEWENDFYDQFYVEYCKLGTGEWLSPNNRNIINSGSYTIENLEPGDTYSFRMVAVQDNIATLPSAAVTLPVADNLRWQQDQFNRRYTELEEIGRGRYSVVKRAKDKGTGFEVALKQVLRRKQTHEVTQAEYTLLAGMQHLHIIRALALFNNAPTPGIDTIVLEL